MVQAVGNTEHLAGTQAGCTVPEPSMDNAVLLAAADLVRDSLVAIARHGDGVFHVRIARRVGRGADIQLRHSERGSGRAVRVRCRLCGPGVVFALLGYSKLVRL